MMHPKTSLLTITFNCMVAGIIAGILFSIFLCVLVLLIVGSGDATLSQQQINDYKNSLTGHPGQTAAILHRQIDQG